MTQFNLQLTDSLSLRTWNQETAPSLFALIDSNREHLGRWLPWVPLVTTIADSEKFINDSLASWEQQRSLELGIWKGTELVGCIGLHELDRLHNKTSIGYWLGAEFQGQGFMTQAVQALVEYCFMERQFHRVEIRAAVDNEASRAIPERLGFTQEGILRDAELVAGRYLDTVVYSKLNPRSEVELPIGA